MTSAAQEIARIAAAYPPEAANTPRWERERYLSDIQRAAWDKRFADPCSAPSEDNSDD